MNTKDEMLEEYDFSNGVRGKLVVIKFSYLLPKQINQLRKQNNNPQRD